MLDPNALAQLNTLKTSIRAERNLHAGTVRGSQGRFGFLSLDDGREAFLAPDEMQKVFPGDLVEAEITETESGKLEAKLDKLIKAQPQRLVGQYVIKGKGHFIAVDMPQLNRWLFIPPKSRNKLKEGDFATAKVIRHPFEDGKAQVKPLDVLGNPDTAFIERAVTCYKHDIKDGWSQEALEAATACSDQVISQLSDSDTRKDLSALPFVTIDSKSTKDMDDALCVETTEEGWKLTVAIADPGSAIELDSPLEKEAAKRGSTTYFPGRAATMLPEELATETFSLKPGELKPAVVATLNINSNGDISDYTFEEAQVKSHHKLSYNEVSQYLDSSETTDSIDEVLGKRLVTLKECSDALLSYRKEHLLIMDNQDDYYFITNEQGKITDIARQSKTIAHQLVEEAMLATNRCAGEFLSEGTPFGLFSAHQGFREERQEDVLKVLGEDCPELEGNDINTLEGYRSTIKSLQASESHKNLVSSFRMMLQASAVDTVPSPHFGLGMNRYATITSPIRRYSDLFNHYAIKAKIAETEAPAISPEKLESLRDNLSRSRVAARDVENWLVCEYLKNQPAKDYEGEVSWVSSQGVSVSLLDNGIRGFVKLDPKAFEFDPVRLILKGEEDWFIGKTVKVAIDRVDMTKKRINLKLVTGEAKAESVEAPAENSQ